MKAEYNSLLYAYESHNSDILSIIADELDMALEAEGETSTSGDSTKVVRDTIRSDESKAASKTLLINKIITKVKELIKKIFEIFDSLKRKLSNRLRLLAETDKGFFNLYYRRKSMIKPYDRVKVITYQYNDNFLDMRIEKIMSETITCLDKLRAVNGTTNGNSRISEIINAPQGKTIEVLLSPYIDSGDAPINTIPNFVKYIVSKYRGDKKEIIFNNSQLPQIEAGALSTKQIANKCNSYLESAQSSYNKIKTLEQQIRRTSESDEEIKLVMSNASKAATIYNAYSALLQAYYELKIEQSLNYRVILKKFYQF